MKIFVTGANGFIGSNFLNYVFSEGHDVLALRRSEKSTPRVSLLFQPNWLTRTLDDIKSSDLEGAEVIVHLAAHSMTPPYDTLENCMYWNVMAPIKLFDQAIKAGVKKIVVAGSCFEYGLSGQKYEYIPVDAPLQPTQTYAASKAASSIAFFQLALEKKIDLTYFRIFHVYGQGESPNRLWPSLKKAAKNNQDYPMTKGEQIRDFIHVNEVVKKLYQACCINDNSRAIPKIYNLGTGKPQSVLEFARYWWNQWGSRGELRVGQLPYRKGEIMRYVPEINT